MHIIGINTNSLLLMLDLTVKYLETIVKNRALLPIFYNKINVFYLLLFACNELCKRSLLCRRYQSMHGLMLLKSC